MSLDNGAIDQLAPMELSRFRIATRMVLSVVYEGAIRSRPMNDGMKNGVETRETIPSSTLFDMRISDILPCPDSRKSGRGIRPQYFNDRCRIQHAGHEAAED